MAKAKPEIVEYHEWSHGGKGVPWRVNTDEFQQMLRDGWRIIHVSDRFTLLERRPSQHKLEQMLREENIMLRDETRRLRLGENLVMG